MKCIVEEAGSVFKLWSKVSKQKKFWNPMKNYWQFLSSKFIKFIKIANKIIFLLQPQCYALVERVSMCIERIMGPTFPFPRFSTSTTLLPPELLHTCCKSINKWEIVFHCIKKVVCKTNSTFSKVVLPRYLVLGSHTAP